MSGPARSLYFEAPGEVALRERPIPEPGPEEVRVETAVSAISAGTELLVYRGEVPTDMSVDPTLDAFDGDFSFPVSYGYAAVGTVTACGDRVDDAWRGRSVFAFTPHESHFLAAPDSLVPVPDSLSASAAALLPTAETASNLVLDAAPAVGERVAVHGAGVVGLFTTALLAAFPLSSLVAVDPLPGRRALAGELGADETLHPDRSDRLGDRRAADEPPGLDLAIEVSGRPAALDDAVDAVGYDGRVVVGSWYGEKRADLDLGGEFHRDRIDISSSQVSTIAPDRRGRWTTDRRLDTATDLLERVPVEELVTHRVPFADAPRAYDLLDGADAGEGSPLQVLLTYD